MGVGVEIIRIKAVLSSTGLELELELSLAKMWEALPHINVAF